MPVSTLTPDDIVREVKHLPSAPKVLPRLKIMLRDGNSAMHEIVALVRLDPGIAARVLQVANSAYFSKGVRCTTVDEAVIRVGYEQIYELVSYAVASQVLVRPLEIYGIEADELWKMSVTCALAAELLAERTQQDRNVAYTIGLLHCVGMVALDEWSLRGERKLSFCQGRFPREAVESERAALGFTQAETGAALLKHWEFPSTMSEPVRWQYTPRSSASHLKMASLLFSAKWVRSAVCSPTIAGRPPMPESTYLQPLGLTPTILNGVAGDVVRKLAAVSSLLDVDADDVVGRHRFPGQSWQG
ncbi:MAG: HDOD domain-containing protein [Verrucomicrobiota bacterium]